MNRITKDVATETAKLLLVKRKTEIEKLKKQCKERATEWYNQALPPEVAKCFLKHPKYFKQSGYGYFTGTGIGQRTIDIDMQPTTNITNYQVLNDADAVDLEATTNLINSLEKKYRSYLNDIAISIYHLRTYQNVEREFPEAFKLLPKPKISQVPAINIKSIRCMIDIANC